MEFFNDIVKKSCLRTYGLSQHLKKRSPRVGELFWFNFDGLQENIIIN